MTGAIRSAPVHASKPTVRFIFLTLLLDVMGFGLLIPVGPRLVEHLQGTLATWPLAHALTPGAPLPAGAAITRAGMQSADAAAAPIVGYLMATYAICQFLFAPMLGSLSDRFGRRPIILLALLGSALDYFAGALAPTLLVLFITRAINGLSGANFSVCYAYVADVTPPDKRAGAYGLMGAAFGLGFVIGPLIGGWLGHVDVRLPFWVAGALTLLNMLYGWRVLPESLPRERRRAFSILRANPLGALIHLLKYRLVLGMLGALFFLNLAMYGLHAVWVLYTKHRYGWDEVQTGLSLTAVGLCAAVVQGGLAGRVVRAIGEARALLMGLAIGVAAYVGYGLATEGWMIYAIIAAASIGGVAGPASQAIITRSVPLTEQGEVQGAMTSASNIALIFGSPLAGTVLAHFIAPDAPVYLPGAPFFLSGALALMGLIVAALVLRRYHVPQGQVKSPRDVQPAVERPGHSSANTSPTSRP